MIVSQPGRVRESVCRRVFASACVCGSGCDRMRWKLMLICWLCWGWSLQAEDVVACVVCLTRVLEPASKDWMMVVVD